jgi:hypothetical protein
MSEKTTFKTDGVTYQVRRNQCGNDCKTCREDGGHVAYYKYVPVPKGEKQQRGTWVYFGTKPPVPTGAPAATCQHEGCTNPTPRHGQKYCSAKCRVAANRAK